MVVLRESIGANKQDELLVPLGKGRLKLPDGREADFEMAAFEFIGDMHIRFVFDSAQAIRIATPQELAQLNLPPDRAVQLAVANIKRVHGNPDATPWTAGLLQVSGRSPDFDSATF